MGCWQILWKDKDSEEWDIWAQYTDFEFVNVRVPELRKLFPKQDFMVKTIVPIQLPKEVKV